jgi:hypothetical protein
MDPINLKLDEVSIFLSKELATIFLDHLFGNS